MRASARLLRQLVALIVALFVLSAVAPGLRTYYPGFIQRVEDLADYIHRRQSDMRTRTGMDPTHTDQLAALNTALHEITDHPDLWPRYKELG